MERRHFINSSLALLGTVALGLQTQQGLATGFSEAGIRLKEQADNTAANYGGGYAEEFAAQLRRHPLLLGWQGLSADIPPYTVAWQGKLPPALDGRNLYRNGPGMQQRGNVRYQHWFDGDGFIHRFTLNNQGLTHQGQFVRTAKFNAESQAGRFLYAGTGSPVPAALPIRSNETINMANTALLPVAGELWALWEAGAPYRLNADTLDTLGRHSIEPQLAGLPFSAHPHRDSDGNIWNFGDLTLLGYPGMLLYQLSPGGRLLKQQVLPVEPGYIHDFAVTERFLVFYLPPITRTSAPLFIDTLIWQPEREGRLLVLDKNTLSIALELPFDAGFAFHFGQAIEHSGRLSLSLCWYPDATVMLSGMRRIADEDKLLSGSKAVLHHIHIDLNRRRARLESTGIAMEFIQSIPSAPGQTRPSHTGVGLGKNSSQFNAIVRVDDDGHSDSFDFGTGVIAEEPLYLAGNTIDDSYVINTSLHYLAGETRVNVFAADKLSDGPIAQAQLAMPLPLGFHGTVI
ncbi:carotenoid oxygenase family protein [Shewanella sp. GXUN23E]|uniref:carotenoid oxygenase family protein n=1 Tax=Shewanella sp. GXUN23E TaxID=3422498 RepID=UPI003D7CFABF